MSRKHGGAVWRRRCGGNGAAASVEDGAAKSSAMAGVKSGSLTASVSSSASSSTAPANGEMGTTGSMAGDYIAKELVPIYGTNQYERWALVPVYTKNRYQCSFSAAERAGNNDHWYQLVAQTGTNAGL